MNGVMLIVRLVWLCSLLGVSTLPVIAYADVLNSVENKTSEPLWELGAAGGMGYVADYPAAEQSHMQGVILPYFIYRGERLRVFDEKGGVRGRLFNSERVELDMSVSGSLPTDSEDNDARRGMPDIDYLAEIGPRLDVTLSDLNAQQKLALQIPLRIIVSTDLSRMDFQGLLLSPDLVWTDPHWFDTDYQFSASVGASFASEDFLDYFYQVDSAFATPVRPEFNAKGGYLGSRLKISLAKTLGKNTRLLGVVTSNYYGGAANTDSPLYGQDLNMNIGVAVVHTFWESSY